MDLLSEEIILHILKHLSSKDLVRIGAVNHRLRRLSLDKTLWISVDLSSTTIPLRNLAQILRRGTRKLVLRRTRVEDPLATWAKCFTPTKLEEIDLSKASISPRALGHLLKTSSRLTTLRLGECKVNHIAYKAIAASAHLQLLDLNSCEKLTTLGFKTIFSGARSLEEVDVSEVSKMYEHIHEIRSPSLWCFMAAKCGLEYWDFVKLLEQCPNITHLDLSDNFVGPIGVEKLKKKFPSLVEVINIHTNKFQERESDYLSDEYSSEEAYDD